MQGRTAAQVCESAGGAAEAAAERLPLLYELLSHLAQGKWFKQLEQLCSVMHALRGPAWLSACVASWPLEIATENGEHLVCPPSIGLHASTIGCL